MGKIGRYDANLIATLRAVLVERYQDRLAPLATGTLLLTTTPRPCRGERFEVAGFQDPEFVKFFGVGLSKVPDSMLLNLSMVTLMEKVHRNEPISYFEGEG